MVMRVILLISIFLGLGLTAEAVPEKSAIAVPETVVATPPPVILPAVAPLTATPPPVILPIASQASGPETISYATVTIENPAARVVISTQRASIDRFELKASHPIKLPRHLHRNDDESIGLPVQSDPNGKKIKPPLAVLSAFSVESSTEATRLAKNQHHWLSNDSETALAWGIRGNETSPWTIASRSPEAATLTWSNGRGLSYAVTYRLHATLAQLAVQVAVTNNGTTPVALKPAVTLINGIHQDYAPNEAAYMVAFTHRGGDQDGTI